MHKVNSAKYKDDDISLYMDLNKVKFIEGEKNNFKITDWSDFENLKKAWVVTCDCCLSKDLYSVLFRVYHLDSHF